MANNIDDLAAAITGLSTAINAQLDVTKKAEERRTKEDGDRAKSAKGMWAIQKVTKTITQEMKKVLVNGLKLQEKSLGRGMSLQGVLEATRSQQNQMAGSLTGFSTAVQIGYEQFESGMKSNNAGINELALYTKLTGGNSKKLLKELASLTRGMGLTSEQQTSLGTTIQGLSQNFKMTTEEIVGAVQGLGDTMRTLKVLNIGAEITEGAAILTAAMGKQAGDMGSKLISTLLSAEGMYTATYLGVQKERLQLLRNEGDANTIILAMIEKASTNANNLIEQIGTTADPTLVIKQLEKTLGRGLGDAKLVYEQLLTEARLNNRSIGQQLEVARISHETNQKFITSWDNFKSQVMSPIQEGIKNLLGTVFTFAADNIEWLKVIAMSLGVGGALGVLGTTLKKWGTKAAGGAGGALSSAASRGRFVGMHKKVWTWVLPKFSKIFLAAAVLSNLGMVAAIGVAVVSGVGLIIKQLAEPKKDPDKTLGAAAGSKLSSAAKVVVGGAPQPLDRFKHSKAAMLAWGRRNTKSSSVAQAIAAKNAREQLVTSKNMAELLEGILSGSAALNKIVEKQRKEAGIRTPSQAVK